MTAEINREIDSFGSLAPIQVSFYLLKGLATHPASVVGPGRSLSVATSGPSDSNFRVDRLQFIACVVDSHLPVDSSLFGVDFA